MYLMDAQVLPGRARLPVRPPFRIRSDFDLLHCHRLTAGARIRGE